MPIYDDTVLNLILAGEKTAADDELDAGHPTAYRETLGAAVEASRAPGAGTSGTSVTIGTGAKQFTLDTPKGWKQGAPIFAVVPGSPTNWMAGQASVDETAGGVLTVDVVLTHGAGTHTSWNLLQVLAVSEVVSPPVAVADGGTGATTEATARDSLEAQRGITVEEARDNPPAGPAVGEKYLVLPGATGDWAGQDNTIATWDGAAWAFEAPEAGTLAHEDVPGRSRSWVYHPGVTKWRRIDRAGEVPTNYVDAPFPPGDPTPVVSDYAGAPLYEVYLLSDVQGGSTITLPSAASVRGKTVVFSTRGAAWTVNVAGGGTVAGQASLVVAAHDSLRVQSMMVDQAATLAWVKV